MKGVTLWSGKELEPFLIDEEVVMGDWEEDDCPLPWEGHGMDDEYEWQHRMGPDGMTMVVRTVR